MSKFVIECPKCGNYTEASTGGFLGIGKTKKINCTCGYVIDVAAEKVTSKTCPHCGNNVIFDQSRGEDAVCPVCHQHINTRESMSQIVEFTCPSCSCRLSADKNAAEYSCPLCDTVINVQQQIAKESVKDQGLASVIKYEGANDTLVWKHPIEDFNLGSQLIVHESQEAIFFKDGRALDLFGAGRYTLATQNLPALESLYKLPTNADEVFHSEVYFINLSTQMGIKWGTDSKVRLFDPGSGLHIEIGACGNFNLRVTDSRKLLLKVVGTTGRLTNSDIAYDSVSVQSVGALTTTEYTAKFKSLIMNKVKSNLARIIKENNINILEIDEQLDVLSEKLRVSINETLDEYGLTMPEFFITNVMTPDDDPNYRRLKEQFAEKTLRVRQEQLLKAEAEAAQGRKLVEAQTEAQLKMVSAQGDAEALKIKAIAEAEAYKAQAYAEAEEMRAKGYTYQQETARQVGLQAMQNGITGNGTAGGLGDIAGLGVTLGAMGGVMSMTREAINPVMQGASEIGAGIGGAVAATATAGNDSWNCPCGAMGITSKCCPECGSKRPEPVKADTWTCPECGASGITSKFCPECGAKKPEPPAAWDCPACGFKGITSKFCPDCGAKKPEAPATWDCPDCGEKNITSKFCPNCGRKKEG
ncbi:MAG: SPFH domain-containing protein [Oscillospiraceae bacterium]|nr:SPFH domain-containing protein [Oscillospiraceae bacterium]